MSTITTPSLRRTRITLDHVARATGLGRTTVSDILHRPAGEKYSDETRQRVLNAVEKLGYTPSRAAQDLARGRSGRIGLLLTRDFSNPFFARMADITEREVRRRKMRLQLVIANYGVQGQTEQARQLLADQIEGLILGPVYNDREFDAIRQFLSERVPVVLIGHGIPELDSVGLDHYAAGRMIAQRLLKRGHKIIGNLCAPDEDLSSASASLFAGLRDELQASGHFDLRWIIRQPDTGRFEVFAATIESFIDSWIAAPAVERPTAMACHNDQVAMTALSCLHRRGIRVPHDLSLVGFDNLPESQYLVPPLTTVDNHVDRCMQTAVELVSWRLEHPRAKRRSEVIQGSWVERMSVGDR